MLWLLPVHPAAAQCTLRFSGTISDGDTKEKLAGASVEIPALRIRVETDDKGRFRMEGLCPGHYDIVITHVGCQTLQAHIHIRDDFSQDYVLEHAQAQLAEVTVVGIVSRAGSSEDLKGRALDATRGQSLGEQLRGITGVSVLQTGTNIYKPVIHGLHSNRVLILNNGIRQEAQQWGNEHAPEVDPYIANRISVIKGASTLRYGSDAIGGVVLVEPKLLRTLPGTGGEINLAGFSNNRMGALSGILEGNLRQLPAFSWRVQGTYRRGGNARTPGYWLDNSGLKEYNFSLTAGWRKTRWGTELFYSQFNTRLGIFSGAHIGNLTDLMNAITTNQPPDYIRDARFSYTIARPFQLVQHHLIKSKTYINTGTVGRLNIIASWQYNNRKEYDKKRFQSSDESPQLDLSIGTAGLDLVWDHYTWKNWRGTLGVSAQFQDNQYSRRLFIPNFQAFNTGVFWIEKWEKNNWTWEGGLRFDDRRIFNTNNNERRIYPDQQYSSLSGNTGLTYKWKSGVQVNFGLSTAWRAPNINELYSDGLHHGAARIEKGDSSLQAERANSLVGGLVITRVKWGLELGLYSKWITDFIYLEPSFPPQLTIRGAFPTFRFRQTDARLSGLDFLFRYELSHHLQWVGKASLLRAWNRRADDWLIQMPADRLEAEFRYQFNNNRFFRESYAKIGILQVFEQTRVPATGNIELTRPDGSKYFASDYTPPPGAYTLVSAEAGTVVPLFRQPLSLILSVSNLLNTQYRDYMNAFRYYADEMGRNISLKLKLPFEFQSSHKQKSTP